MLKTIQAAVIFEENAGFRARFINIARKIAVESRTAGTISMGTPPWFASVS